LEACGEERGVLGSVKYPMGLDLGSHSVKALQLKGSGGARRAAVAAVEPLEAGAIVDGAILDRDAVSDAIRRVSHRGAFARSVCLGLPGTVVIVRRVRVTNVAEADRDEAIRWEAAQQIPFDIEDVHLDYQAVRTSAPHDEPGTAEVLVAAAKRRLSPSTPRP
jgi:type IV pilus assembly protein PilM